MTSLDQAGEFVDEFGFALLFPAPGLDLPSLFEAVAGPGVVPFASGMNDAESLVWSWKDELPPAGLAWYGKFLYRRASLLSPRVLAALYPGPGDDDDHRSLELSREAHQIADALRPGPLTTAALREIVGHRSRYERAMGELHRQLLITSGGVEPQRTGWPATVIELTCRAFPVGAEFDRGSATRRFLTTVGSTGPRELARAFGWPVAVARAELDSLIASGFADPDPDHSGQTGTVHIRPAPPAPGRRPAADPAAGPRRRPRRT
jgi:hypothetical protein